VSPFPIRRSALPAAARTATALLAALLLSACSGSSSVHVAVPAPSGAAAKQCAELKAALPRTLGGKTVRTVSPASAYTAAWGSPAITLRCGVPEPGVLDPSSPAYDPTGTNSSALDLNGLCWVSENLTGGAYRFTTIKQQAYVEVDVPAAYQGDESPLPGLTGPVLRTDPVGTANPFACA